MGDHLGNTQYRRHFGARVSLRPSPPVQLRRRGCRPRSGSLALVSALSSEEIMSPLSGFISLVLVYDMEYSTILPAHAPIVLIIQYFYYFVAKYFLLNLLTMFRYSSSLYVCRIVVFLDEHLSRQTKTYYSVSWRASL
jgi:hypothetical protein